MKRISSSGLRPRPAVILATIGAAAILAFGNGCMNGRQQTTAPVSGPSSSAAMAAPPKTLTGAELYALNCNRCHPERSPVERRSAEWKTILTHMRVRANLPAAQARAILQYLQENSGS